MVRPGPKTRIEDVKTAVVKLLRENPDGLNFNKIFDDLKDQKVLGSYSILSRALKDLCEAHVAKYKDVKVPRYRIPKRIYTLSGPMDRALRRLTQSYTKAKMKEAVSLKDIALNETLLRHIFWVQTNNLMGAYRDLLHDENPSDKNARWRFILNLELRYIRAFMDSVAKAVSEGEIPIEEAGKVAHEVQKEMM